MTALLNHPGWLIAVGVAFGGIAALLFIPPVGIGDIVCGVLAGIFGFGFVVGGITIKALLSI